ncbi:hypothetical protein B5G50_15940 [Brevibacillus brevis]|uniref:hypothetical protein n=1 Tax=Brevibacillus brevis TaxID=1393 RepID=UPI000B381A3D|nr:hypothetical protein [Brevibacillus brevis]OUQ87494.1 hypothetical protein B5G50_15940 [Brevibacillus brevis]
MKKVIASLLTLTVALSLSASAFAAEPVKNVKSSSKAAAMSDAYEPNDDPDFAPYINSNVSYTAQISHNRDADYYNFYAKPGEIKFALSKLSSDSKQLDIIIQKPGGQKVKGTYTKGNTSFTAHIPEEGQYYIFIVHSDGFFDPTPISAIPYTFKAIFNQ